MSPLIVLYVSGTDRSFMPLSRSKELLASLSPTYQWPLLSIYPITAPNLKPSRMLAEVSPNISTSTFRFIPYSVNLPFLILNISTSSGRGKLCSSVALPAGVVAGVVVGLAAGVGLGELISLYFLASSA